MVLKKAVSVRFALFAWGDHLSLDPHTGEYVIFTLSLPSPLPPLRPW